MTDSKILTEVFNIGSDNSYVVFCVEFCYGVYFSGLFILHNIERRKYAKNYLVYNRLSPL